MNLFSQFKLTTKVDRFKNLPPAVWSNTVIIWDGDEAFFWCEKHHKYFEENEHCPCCNLEQERNEETACY